MGIYSSGHGSLSLFSTTLFLVFTVSHHLRHPDRDGGVYPGYSKSHRSTRPQSTPKPADSWWKITGDAFQKPTISYFLASVLTMPYHSHQNYRSLRHFLVCSFFLMITLFIFHFTLFHFDNTFYYIRCECPQCLLRLFSNASPIPIPGSNFPIAFIFYPPFHLSFPLSSLHLLRSTPIGLSTQVQAIKCTHLHTFVTQLTRAHANMQTHVHTLFASHIWGSVFGDSADLIKVSAGAKVESVTFGFTAAK